MQWAKSDVLRSPWRCLAVTYSYEFDSLQTPRKHVLSTDLEVRIGMISMHYGILKKFLFYAVKISSWDE